MIYTDIKDILKQFEKQRQSRQKNKQCLTEKDIEECFMPVAQQLLYGGYFSVSFDNQQYFIQLGAVELYYHEEDGSIKDPIMYHTVCRMKNTPIFKRLNRIPYFEMGAFNLHISGVDITFENEDQKYRASCLIREYRVLETTENPATSTKKYDPCSTHIFDDMFPIGISFGESLHIEWIPFKNVDTLPIPKTGWRKNVAKYYEKSFIKLSGVKNDPVSSKYNVDRYVNRNWQFYK
jgi:hypothetical protein